MKLLKGHLPGVALIIALGGTACAAGWPEVFDPFEPLTIYLEVDTQDWDRVRFDQPSQSASWVPEVAQAWMHGEGESPILVGVRRKGESDIPLPSSSDPRKVSLKIDINEYLADQRWHDLSKISLENGSTDPLNEGFGWLIHRQAEPLYTYQAALSGWVRLFINGDEVGVFTSAEQRDATFLRNHDLFSPTCTWLYKVDGGTALEVGTGNSPAFDNLQFDPFTSGPGGGGKGGGTSPPVDFDAYLPQWVHMRGMLTLAACNAFIENSDSLFTHAGKNSFCVDFDPPFARTRRYYPWDLDTSIKDGTTSIYGASIYQTTILDHPWFGRVYEHILRELLDGPLSVEAMTNILGQMQAGLTEAFTADPYVYPGGPAATFDSLRAWVATRNATIRTQFRHVFVPRPELSHPGGEVIPGFALCLSAPTGTVYFTQDGTDPRAPGGSPSTSATAYAAPIIIESPRHIIARTLVDTNWSGLPAEASFTIAHHGGELRVTEIMYNPVDVDLSDTVDNDAYEFIEFRNTGPHDLDLSSYSCDGITFDFPVGFTVAPGAFVVLVRDPAAFEARYPGVHHDGVYLGKLGNDGEKVRLRRPDGTTVISVEYSDGPPWVLSPDGMGYSLVNIDVNGDPDDAANWRASTGLFGSPGAEDPTPSYSPGVVFNEILSHTDPPFEDTIELYNPTDGPIDVSHWYLSDAARDTNKNYSATLLKKFQIPPGTILPPGGFAVFYEKEFNGGAAASPFALTEFGESLYLSAADSSGNLLGYVMGLAFPALQQAVPYGRVMTPMGPDYAPLQYRTFGVDDPATVAEFRTGTGRTNAPGRAGPVVFSEIMYNPPTNLTEFIEIANITTTTVDISDWKLNGAGGFVFPSGTTLPAGGLALLVDTNRITVEAFRTQRDVPSECIVFGTAMTLDNNGERLTILQPNDDPDPLAPPWPIESVRYNDRAPWPTEADGAGPSLERYEMTAYGNDPLNWRTSRTGGSPGRANRFDAGLAITAGSRWLYKSTPSSLGTAWRASDYADNVWPDGHAPLGYGEPDVVTFTPYGPDPTHKYPTLYLRKPFTLPEDPARIISLVLDVRYDDGFVAYLNGTEMARGSMPTGATEHATLADSHESGAFETIPLGTNVIGLLQQGRNMLAVELHQDDVSSQDMFWDARLSYLTGDMLIAAPPVATPGSRLFMGAVTVAVSCATADAVIRYTLDGTPPDETSPIYSAPQVFTTTTTLKTRAYALDFSPSPVTTFIYRRIEFDGDSDSLPDAWEIQWLGPIALYSGTEDPDSDRASNYDEFISGTDPLDPDSFPFLSIQTDAGAPHVRFRTIATDPNDLAYQGLNRCYSLLSTATLDGTSTLWSAEAGMELVPADNLLKDFPIAPGRQRSFFRLGIRLTP